MHSQKQSELVEDKSYEPAVRGFVHTPQMPVAGGIVLTHGAGGNANSPLLIALAEASRGGGFLVLRCDLPFRQSHPGPPRPGENARDRMGLKNAVDWLRMRISQLAPASQPEPPPQRLFLAGHSYGGRQATMLCAEIPALVSGLVLLSYPLHPPRKPEQKRIQHLPQLNTPALFVHGTRDPFGSVTEMQEALGLIPAPSKLVAVEGAGHDLGFTSRGARAGMPETILQEFSAWFENRRERDAGF